MSRPATPRLHPLIYLLLVACGLLGILALVSLVEALVEDLERHPEHLLYLLFLGLVSWLLSKTAFSGPNR